MNIDIWFDFICPFSYLGKIRFEKALKKFKHNKDIVVNYHNYCIAPYIDRCLDMNAHEYLAYHKDIPYEKAKAINDNLTRVFKAEGINVNFEKLVPTSSKRAHQILKLISDPDAVSAYIDHIFKAHFEDGKDIDNIEVLMKIGKNVGLEESDIMAVYQTDMYLHAIQTDYEDSKALGLSGVPAFVVNRSYYLLGGQPLDAFEEMLEDLYKKEKVKQETAICEGESCYRESKN